MPKTLLKTKRKLNKHFIVAFFLFLDKNSKHSFVSLYLLTVRLHRKVKKKRAYQNNIT